MNKFHIIIIAILIIVVLAMGMLLFNQQRDISQLKTQVFGSKVTSASASATPKSTIPSSQMQKNFIGEIKAISLPNLDVEAKLTKIKDPNKFKTGQPTILGPDDYETITKAIKVILNDNTQYTGSAKEDLKAGDKVFVTADKSPFDVDSLAALQITKMATP